MYLVRYRDLNNRSMIASITTSKSEAAIPAVPIGVNKPAKAKDTLIAARKTTMPPYIHAVVFETSGVLTVFNCANITLTSDLVSD